MVHSRAIFCAVVGPRPRWVTFSDVDTVGDDQFEDGVAEHVSGHRDRDRADAGDLAQLLTLHVPAAQRLRVDPQQRQVARIGRLSRRAPRPRPGLAYAANAAGGAGVGGEDPRITRSRPSARPIVTIGPDADGPGRCNTTGWRSSWVGRPVGTSDARSGPGHRIGRLLLAGRRRLLRTPAGRAIQPGIGVSPGGASPGGASSGGVGLSGVGLSGVNPVGAGSIGVSLSRGVPAGGIGLDFGPSGCGPSGFGVAAVAGSGVGCVVACASSWVVAGAVAGGVFGEVDEGVEGVGVGVFPSAVGSAGFEDPVDDRIQHGVERAPACGVPLACRFQNPSLSVQRRSRRPACSRRLVASGSGSAAARTRAHSSRNSASDTRPASSVNRRSSAGFARGRAADQPGLRRRQLTAAQGLVQLRLPGQPFRGVHRVLGRTRRAAGLTGQLLAGRTGTRPVRPMRLGHPAGQQRLPGRGQPLRGVEHLPQLAGRRPGDGVGIERSTSTANRSRTATTSSNMCSTLADRWRQPTSIDDQSVHNPAHEIPLWTTARSGASLPADRRPAAMEQRGWNVLPAPTPLAIGDTGEQLQHHPVGEERCDIG